MKFGRMRLEAQAARLVARGSGRWFGEVRPPSRRLLWPQQRGGGSCLASHGRSKTALTPLQLTRDQVGEFKGTPSWVALETAMAAKFKKAEARDALLATGKATLIYVSDETYWGCQIGADGRQTGNESRSTPTVQTPREVWIRGRCTLAAGVTGSQPDGRPLYRMCVATLSRPPRVITHTGGRGPSSDACGTILYIGRTRAKTRQDSLKKHLLPAGGC